MNEEQKRDTVRTESINESNTYSKSLKTNATFTRNTVCYFAGSSEPLNCDCKSHWSNVLCIQVSGKQIQSFCNVRFVSVIIVMAVPSQENRETPGTMAGHGFRIRVSSFHMRELTRRKVLVESSKITLLYCIGEG